MLAFSVAKAKHHTGKISLEDFYKQYGLRCLHLACKITGGDRAMAEDALHNAFMVVMKDWENFSALPCQKRFSLFIIIVKNKAIDLLREAKRKRHSELNDEVFDMHDESTEISALIEGEEGYQRLLCCIGKLSEIYQTAFELRYIQELSNSEIAAILNIAPKTVSARVQRAKQQLQKILTKEGIIYEKRKIQ